MLVDIGYGNYLPIERITAILTPDSRSTRKLRDAKKAAKLLIDCSLHRGFTTLVLLDTGEMYISSETPVTLAERIASAASEGPLSATKDSRPIIKPQDSPAAIEPDAAYQDDSGADSAHSPDLVLSLVPDLVPDPAPLCPGTSGATTPSGLFSRARVVPNA